jgi:hypothetical protein
MSEEWKTLWDCPPALPSPLVGDELSAAVRRDLEPGYPRLLGKALALHAVAGTASLMICPQFGVSPLGGFFDPLAFLSPYGDLVCGLGCGLAFSLLTAAASLLFLTRDERREARRLGFWIFTPIMALSWAMLMGLGGTGAEGAHAHPVSTAFHAAWILAAVLTAWGSMRLPGWGKLG